MRVVESERCSHFGRQVLAATFCVLRSWSLRQGRAEFGPQVRGTGGRESRSIERGPVFPANKSALDRGHPSNRIIKRLFRLIDRRDSFQRNHDARRPGRGSGLSADFFPEGSSLVRRRAHQRHGRVVLVELSAPGFFRDGIGGAEAGHVGANCTDGCGTFVSRFWID
jgi:hypothetical protein